MAVTDPIVVVDVGARGGAHKRWLPLGSAVRIVGVDADAEECAKLNARQHPLPSRFLPYALGPSDGATATLYLTKQRGCSSLLEPNAAFLEPFPYKWAFEVEKRLPVTLTSLDTMCAREDVTPTVIKLDTQGSELDILRGGERAIQSALLIESEVEFNPLYIGQPLFGDMDAFLRARGFALLALRRDYFRRGTDAPSSAGGTIMHGDALWYRLSVPKEQQQGFALALSAYRQTDFVRTLTASAPIPDQAPGFVQRIVGRVLSQWPHRNQRDWLDRSRPAGAVDWHDPDFF